MHVLDASASLCSICQCLLLQEVEEKEQKLRKCVRYYWQKCLTSLGADCQQPVSYRSIAKNYSHIKSVENQLAELQLQLNLTSGPKKSALEMLRRKIETKNELVAAAKQKFAAAKQANCCILLPFCQQCKFEVLPG